MRYFVGCEKSRWRKLLLIARFLDALEHDFRDVYPDSPSPLPDGYETTLRTLAKDIDINIEE